VDYSIDQFEYGYTPAVTGEHRAYWGARAIWQGGRTWDIVPNRQGFRATDKAALDTLLARLNGGILKAAEARLGALGNTWEVSPREAREVVLHEDARVRVVANTNASHGYVYLTAQLLEA
jgi:hypothetical protein